MNLLRTNCSCISNEACGLRRACVILLPETFHFNDVLQNWNRDCQSNGESWTIRLLLQPSVSGVAVSLLVWRCQGPRWTFWAHFVVFSCNAENFWIWGFTVWLFRLSPKCNLSETFHQIWALHRWGRQTCSCLL